MTEKQEALKPCPFCGGEARQGKLGGYPYSFFVQCSSLACPCDVSNFDAPEKAVQYWNTRALTEAPKADVAAVKRDCLSAINRFQMQEFVVADAINYVATHYDLVKKETPND